MRDVASANRVVTAEAPAKVNLTLRVLGRRADGYHELESVVLVVGLADRLTFEAAADLRLVCRGADVPAGEDNLVLKAARLLRSEAGAAAGARITLEKRVPAGRGLGGGSSDAAATLLGLSALWGLGRSRGDLAALGARLGSDVPLFLGPPLAVMRGRGERLRGVEAACRWWLTLAWPAYGNPTAEVYAAYDRLPPPAGARPEATAVLARLDGPASGAAECLVNDLEAAARSLRPDGPDLRSILREAGAAAVGMTGSGSAWFALSDTNVQADALADAARAAGAEAAVVRGLGPADARKETTPCR